MTEMTSAGKPEINGTAVPSGTGGQALAPVAMVLRATAAAGVSPKVSAGAMGSAIATIFWTVAAATFWKTTFSAATLAVLTGATATVLTYLLAYFTADPLRADGGVQ